MIESAVIPQTVKYIGSLAFRDQDQIEEITVMSKDAPYTMAELLRGDADGDGDLTVMDATAIQYYLANLKTSYPIGTTLS